MTSALKFLNCGAAEMVAPAEARMEEVGRPERVVAVDPGEGWCGPAKEGREECCDLGPVGAPCGGAGS